MIRKTIQCNSLFDQIQKRELFPILKEWFQILTTNNITAYLVGGCIRDSILGYRNTKIDFDFIIDPFQKSLEATKQFSYIANCHYFPLDETRNTYRLDLPLVQIDINGIRGNDLMDDIFDRDFTINSLCISLEDCIKHFESNNPWLPIIDYFQGSHDIYLKEIRAHNPVCFKNDPLRVLRAIRFASNLKATIHPETFHQMVQDKNLLKNVAKERIREEFLKILQVPTSNEWVLNMENTGILSSFFPFFDWYVNIDRSYTSFLHLKDHVHAGLRYLEEIFYRIHHFDFPYAEELQAVLSKEVISGITMETLMKIGILLHDIGKPDTLQVEKDRLRFFEHENVGVKAATQYLQEYHFSTKEIQFVTSLIKWHMRPHNLSNVENLTPRAKYRFFRDTDPFSIPILLLSMADAYATRLVPMKELPIYEEFIDNMISYALTPGSINQSPLLDGYEIMEVTDLPPGKKIGLIRKLLLEEQNLGTILTKQEAAEWCKRFVKT